MTPEQDPMTPEQDPMPPEQDAAAPHAAAADPGSGDTPAEAPHTPAGREHPQTADDDRPVTDVASGAEGLEAGAAPAGATDAEGTEAGTGPGGSRPDATGTSDDAQGTATGVVSGDGEPADGERPAAGAGGGRRFGRVTRARIAGAVAAMVVAAVAATAVLQWVTAAQAEDARAQLAVERALRLEVSGAASAFSKALLSYDYRDLQTTRATLSAQATGDFLATYDTAFGGAMAQVIVKLKATSQATVREVYLADVDEATAHAIVVVDQQVNTSEAIRSVKDSHLKIALVKEKGTWKVHDVTVLGAASEDQYSLDGGDAKKKD
ncbi:hypothetical protein [Nonomuraea sp. SYSU D8015]|uniref:hypothetical protein n=1 Tax=Nonomuraea sp. SYSU D8015 TaxID=2593644 RepID=UPI0016612736|nr:hypothetical protein [Nonomuraea sp. SYSU D8015]